MDNRIATPEDEVVVLGYRFRSGGHVVWLCLSMLLLACVVVDRSLPPDAVHFTIPMIIGFHGSTAITAVFATNFGRVNGTMYSRDCIWFNALMAGIDAAIAYLGR
ncbi:MAG TPA: hypothetical protein VD862_03905 [Candidatus Paceibacterota bacterium]|nr:hypothetical protein [Candidatus Paceibacterota bacterium]